MLVRPNLRFFLTLILIAISGSAFAEAVWHHQLSVLPDIESGNLKVTDTVTVRSERNLNTRAQSTSDNDFVFRLNAWFAVRFQDKLLEPVSRQGSSYQYRIPVDKAQNAVSLEYEGKIRSTPECEFTRQVCALLNEQGIFLNPALGWYPVSSDSASLHTFDMTVELPDRWRSLSQGNERDRDRWIETNPQDAIYLVAGRFKLFEQEGPVALAQVYLLQDDEALAARYLEATHRYLKHFEALLGDYPYSRFATVESFWESGWGMPSFTLLGPTVLRLPFILYTSFPHEIVHNWWGNSVYIDASAGNWAEGLTAYLTDHGLKKTLAERRDYRRDALDKFAVFTREGNDFPLRQFRSRHNAATQAVGYSKMLMVVHMLRRRMGDAAFYRALKAFYLKYRFRSASMDDLVTTMTSASGMPQEEKTELKKWLVQWIERSGAPKLRIASQQKTDKGVKLELKQLIETEEEPLDATPFDLYVPLVAFADNERHSIVWEKTVRMKRQSQTFELDLPANAERLAVDPFFDLLRKPLAAEIPPNLNAFRAPGKKLLLVAEKPGWWQRIAEFIERESPGQFVRSKEHQADADIASVQPVAAKTGAYSADGKMANAIIRLGALEGGVNGQLLVTGNEYQLNGKNYSRNAHTLVFAVRNGQGQTQIQIDSPDQQQAERVLRKIRHYGKYGVLIFDAKGQNVAKATWQVRHSPLSIQLK